MMISIIVPVHNEENNLERFYAALSNAMADLGYGYEVIFVDDGSVDKSSIIINELALGNRHVEVVRLYERRGQNRAYLAGFDHASGDVIVTMDADLQYDPGDIGDFVNKIQNGFDFVSGYRKERKDTLFRNIVSFAENKIISFWTGVRLYDWGCGFNAFKKELIPLFKKCEETQPALLKPVLASLAVNPCEIVVRHYPRRQGRSKYGIFNMIGIGSQFFMRHRYPRKKRNVMGVK